jgi:NifU-like protein
MGRAQRGGARESSADTDSLEIRARRLVDEVLRPLIAADGGVIEFVSVSSAQLVIRLAGTCAGCPGRPYTVQGVIQRAARKVLDPEMQVEVAAD